MNEIKIYKFRAWDGVDTIMYRTLTDWYWYNKSNYGTIVRAAQPRDDLMLIEQYIGWHDADGVEIYTSDIVESRFGPIKEIRFVENQLRAISTTGSRTTFTSDDADMCKVIGNIHEKPDLMNESDG